MNPTGSLDIPKAVNIVSDIFCQQSSNLIALLQVSD